MLHAGECPRIKAIDYYPDGTTKRVEYHATGFGAWPMSPPVALPKFD
jgi:hypothetical protein